MITTLVDQRDDHQGSIALRKTNQSEADLCSEQEPGHTSEGSPGLRDDRGSERVARISGPGIVRLLRDFEWVWTCQIQSVLSNTRSLLTGPNPGVLRFPGDVIINKDAAQARLFALTEDAASRADAVGVTAEPSVGRTALWTDASCPMTSADDRMRDCGIGVVYRPQHMQRGSDEWITEGYRIPALIEATFAETLAVFWALMIAKKRFSARRAGLEAERTVLIFSDCKDGLSCVRDFRPAEGHVDMMGMPIEMLEMILNTARQLAEEGIKIELHWVPGHKGVPGNELADEVAKQAAKGKQLESRPRALVWGKPVVFDREVTSLDDD